MISLRTILPLCLPTLLLAAGCIEGNRDVRLAATETDTSDPGDTGDATDTKNDNPCPSDACFINGSCRAPGDGDPNNICRECIPEVNPLGYSARPDASSCDDNEQCTLESSCQAGRCKGTFEPECLEIPTCVDRVECDAFGCTHILDDDVCLIDGRCYAPGATDDSGCMLCDARAPLEWVAGNDQVPCNNADLCEVNSLCEAGVCVGKPRDCDDGLDCTLDTCAGGLCVNGPNDGATCSVDDVCQARGVCDGETCETDALHIDFEDNDSISMASLLFPTPPADSRATAVGNLNPSSDNDWFLYDVAPTADGSMPRPRATFVFATDKLEGCLLMACNSADGTSLTRPVPVPSCSDGLANMVSNSFAGCCLTSAGASSRLTLDANCDSGAGRAAVFVTRYGTTQSECPAYEFDWGTVAP